jgi:hypothetical protein
VVRDGDWTRNVCGFWNVGFWSLLLRSSRPNMSFRQWYKEFNIRVNCSLLCTHYMYHLGMIVYKTMQLPDNAPELLW